MEYSCLHVIYVPEEDMRKSVKRTAKEFALKKCVYLREYNLRAHAVIL